MMDRLDEVAGGLAQSEPIQPLFRPEAVSAAGSNGFGRPVALFPITWTLMSVCLLVMAAALALLLGTGRYSRKETVVGIVRSTGGDVRVAAATPGVITALQVTEGQRVAPGQVLLTVETARIGLDGRPVDEMAARSLDSEIANLSSRLAALGSAATIENDGSRARLAALAGERSAARAVERATVARLALAEQALETVGPVAEKGFISGEAIRRRRDEIMALRQASAEAQGRQANLAGQMDEIATLRAARPYTLEQERGQLLDLLARARRDRDLLSAQRGFAVRAPTGGTVTALQASVGQTVDPQRPLMAIGSAQAAVIAEVYVPSRAIGFVEVGQPVRVRYDAFPFQRFGVARGHIQAISGAVLRPTEIQAAVDVREPMYRVVVALEGGSMSAYGKKHRIQPGMALSADIVLDDRRFADWLLDPILSLRGRL